MKCVCKHANMYKRHAHTRRHCDNGIVSSVCVLYASHAVIPHTRKHTRRHALTHTQSFTSTHLSTTRRDVAGSKNSSARVIKQCNNWSCLIIGIPDLAQNKAHCNRIWELSCRIVPRPGVGHRTIGYIVRTNRLCTCIQVRARGCLQETTPSLQREPLWIWFENCVLSGMCHIRLTGGVRYRVVLEDENTCSYDSRVILATSSEVISNLLPCVTWCCSYSKIPNSIMIIL